MAWKTHIFQIYQPNGLKDTFILIASDKIGFQKKIEYENSDEIASFCVKLWELTRCVPNQP